MLEEYAATDVPWVFGIKLCFKSAGFTARGRNAILLSLE